MVIYLVGTTFARFKTKIVDISFAYFLYFNLFEHTYSLSSM